MDKSNDNMTSELLDAKAEVKQAAVPAPDLDTSEDEGQHWFAMLSGAEKRFHVLFYALAGLTGILLVQLIWQIAVLTAR